MTSLKYLIPLFSVLIFSACNNTSPNYTGQWEQVNESKTIKRFLTITQNGEHYQIIDELKDTSTGEVSYDEKSNGILDGQELLMGTNTLTNVLSLEAESDKLTMKTYDKTTLHFVKVD